MYYFSDFYHFTALFLAITHTHTHTHAHIHTHTHTPFPSGSLATYAVSLRQAHPGVRDVVLMSLLSPSPDVSSGNASSFDAKLQLASSGGGGESLCMA